MSLPERLAWGAGFGTTAAGNSFPMTGTADNTNFPGLGFGPVPPGMFGPISPRFIVPIIDPGFLLQFPVVSPGNKVAEPDIPMAPPTNRRRIKLRD